VAFLKQSRKAARNFVLFTDHMGSAAKWQPMNSALSYASGKNKFAFPYYIKLIKCGHFGGT